MRLTTNFRTVPPVLDWVNGVFGRLMPDEVPASQPRYEPLDAAPGAVPGGDHRPVLLGGPAREARRPGSCGSSRPATWPPPSTTSATDPDALAGADDGDGGRLAAGPARRRHHPAADPHLAAATCGPRSTERYIPYRLNTGTLVYDTQEVRDALAALRAIDDPTDELSLVAALRSPLYACADTDLFTFQPRRRPLGPPPPDAARRASPPTIRWPRALAHLRTLWEQRWWLRPSLLLDRLLDRSAAAFVLAFGERPSRREVWGRLRFLVDQARAFEEAGGGAACGPSSTGPSCSAPRAPGCTSRCCPRPTTTPCGS